VSATNSPVKGDSGQANIPGVSPMTGREQNIHDVRELEMTSANEFGEFVSSESDLPNLEKGNDSLTSNEMNMKVSDNSNEIPCHSKNENDLIELDTDPQSRPVFFSGNESDRIQDSSPNLESSPKEMRIGNIVYHPVTESSKGPVSAEDIESAKVVLSKLSVEEFEQQKSRSQSTPVDIPVVQQPARSDSRSASFGSFNVAPHLNAFVNYATGLFKSGSDIKDVGEVIPDTEQSKENKGKTDILDIKGKSDMIKQRLRSLGSSPKEKSDPSGADLEVAVENAVKLADKPELFQSFDSKISLVCSL
jgi:hypothetical protein